MSVLGETRPDEKGIETICTFTISVAEFNILEKLRPDEKGIETAQPPLLRISPQ